MITHGARLLAVVVPLFLAVAACADAAAFRRSGGDDPASIRSSPTATPAGSGTTVALRVDWIGGFTTPERLATRLPILAVYLDGRVIDEGPVIAIAPPPALPNLQLRRISTAAVHQLVDRAIAAGVGSERDFGEPPIADVPSTRFTIRTAAGVRTMEVPALFEADGAGLTAHQRSARRAAQDLFNALTDLPSTLGAGVAGETEPYSSTAVAVAVTPRTDSCPSSPGPATSGPCGDGLAGQGARAWPGPALPGEPLGEYVDLTCVTATGDEATTLLAAARTAVTTTPWTSGGRQWTVSFRPLLPHESGCADLRPTG